MSKRKTLMPIAIVAALLMTACSSNQDSQTETLAMPDKNEITLINPFVVPEAKLDETIDMWLQARDFLQMQPGYISTELHQSVAPDATFRLINVAKWESPETFKAATAKMNAEAGLPRIEGLVPNPALYTVAKRD